MEQIPAGSFAAPDPEKAGPGAAGMPDGAPGVPQGAAEAPASPGTRAGPIPAAGA